MLFNYSVFLLTLVQLVHFLLLIWRCFDCNQNATMVVAGTTKLGNTYVAAVNAFQTIDPSKITKETDLIRQIFSTRTGKLLHEFTNYVWLGGYQVCVRIVGMDIGFGALQVHDEYRQAYVEDFEGQTSAWINNDVEEV
jgi:hypothetical protein